MADISITKSRGKKYLGGTSPIIPNYVEGETPPPNNPPGDSVSTYKQLGDVTDQSFVGKNGFVPVVVDEGLLTLQPLPQIQENGLVSGGIVQWTGSGYVFNVSSSFYRIGGNSYSTDPTQKTLSTPDATNNRIDVFAVDVNGVVVVIEGTPSATPVKPQINPSTQLELTSVLVIASSSEPILTEDLIYDENVEWTGSSSGTGTVSFNSTNDPFQGTVSIETTNIQNGLKVRLTDGADIDVSTFQTIGFQIKLKEGLFGGQEIGLTFLDSSGSAVSNQSILNVDKSSTAYQFIGIALSNFSFTNNSIRAIEFEFIRTKGQSVNDGYFLDVIKLEGGINPPINVGSFTVLSDTPSSYLGQGGKTVAVKADESGLEFVAGGGGASTFLALTDTPSTYSGQSGLFPRVNGSETALKFDSVSPYDLDQEGASDGDVLTWVTANSRFEPVTPSGGSSLWTDAASHIYRNGQVTIGATSLFNAQLHVEGNFNSTSLGVISLYNYNTGGIAFSVNNGASTRYFEINGQGDTRARGYAIIGTSYAWAVNGNITVNRFTANRMTLNADFLQFANNTNIITGTTTGTKICTATTQKLSFWNKTPIIQPTTAITAATFVANTSGIVDDTATFDGYTIGQIVAALRAEGLLA